MTKSVKVLSTRSKDPFTLAENSTHIDMPQILAKAGFTLTEVLITLGIIGVIVKNDNGDVTCKKANTDKCWGCSHYYLHNYK